MCVQVVSAKQNEAQNELDRWKSLKVDWQPLLPAGSIPHNGRITLMTLFEHVDVLQWWKQNEQLFPRLAVLARIYLACPSSQSFQERVFSGGKVVMTEKRSRMNLHVFEQLTVLRHNKKK